MGEVECVLAEASLLAGLSRAEIADIERAARVVQCATDQTLRPSSDSDHRLYFLVEGRVALRLVLRPGEHCGGEREIVLERAGDVLGWTLMMKRERLMASARCIEPSRLVAVDFERLPAETGLTLAKRLALHLHAQLRRLELCRPDAGRPGRADRNGDER